MKARLQDTSVADQAAQWVVEFDDSTESPRLDEFAVWLKASPQNVEGFLMAAAAWGEFDGMDPGKTLDVRKMVREVGENVVVMGEKDTHLTPALSAPNGRRGGWKMAMAAGVAAAAVGVGLLIASARSTYSTDTGEQRTVKLMDGSVVYLNTRSKLRVRYSDGARDVQLLQGEALFEVQQDPTRPFRVNAGGPAIQVVGTEFNVYRRTKETTVSVLEGAVRVSEQEFKAGEAAAIAPNGVVERRPVMDIADAVAWRQRRLVFRDTPLPQIVEEFNRYNAEYKLKLQVKTSPVQLTGVFRADDPDALLLFLDGNSKLKIERGVHGAVIR